MSLTSPPMRLKETINQHFDVQLFLSQQLQYFTSVSLQEGPDRNVPT